MHAPGRDLCPHVQAHYDWDMSYLRNMSSVGAISSHLEQRGRTWLWTMNTVTLALSAPNTSALSSSGISSHCNRAACGSTKLQPQHPETLNPSTPQPLNPSTLQPLNPSTPQPINPKTSQKGTFIPGWWTRQRPGVP